MYRWQNAIIRHGELCLNNLERVLRGRGMNIQLLRLKLIYNLHTASVTSYATDTNLCSTRKPQRKRHSRCGLTSAQAV